MRSIFFKTITIEIVMVTKGHDISACIGQPVRKAKVQLSIIVTSCDNKKKEELSALQSKSPPEAILFASGGLLSSFFRWLP